jgi:hypothetical protein
MRRFVISLALLAGCRDEGIVELEGIRDDVCKCKDAKCGEEAMKRVATSDVPNSRRSQVIAREMMDCLARLYEADRPTTGPDDGAEP